VTNACRSALVAAGAAVVVLVGCLVFAYSLRPPSTSTAAPRETTAEEGLRCGSAVCRSVLKQVVGDDAVEVLVGSGTGRIKVTGPAGPNIFESSVVESGAVVDDSSLQCVPAAVSVCLVRGRKGDISYGEVLVERSGAWTRTQAPYVATGGYLALHDVDGDQVADLVAVQRPCDPTGCKRLYAQVFSFSGTPVLGCTSSVTALDDLPGWPEVAPRGDDLHSCGA
jgi:hypothetical protein